MMDCIKEVKDLPGLNEILASVECTTDEGSSVSKTSKEKRRSTAKLRDDGRRRSHKKRGGLLSTSDTDDEQETDCSRSTFILRRMYVR